MGRAQAKPIAFRTGIDGFRFRGWASIRSLLRGVEIYSLSQLLTRRKFSHPRNVGNIKKTCSTSPIAPRIQPSLSALPTLRTYGTSASFHNRCVDKSLRILAELAHDLIVVGFLYCHRL